jgi:hypothetical protein
LVCQDNNDYGSECHNYCLLDLQENQTVQSPKFNELFHPKSVCCIDMIYQYNKLMGSSGGSIQVAE